MLFVKLSCISHRQGMFCFGKNNEYFLFFITYECNFYEY